MIKRLRDQLILALGGVVPEQPRQSFVAEPEWHRVEELRPDLLGPSEEDIRSDDPEWTPPPGLTRDPWAPRRTLGPISD